MGLPGIRVDENKFMSRDSWGSKPQRRPEGEVGQWFQCGVERTRSTLRRGGPGWLRDNVVCLGVWPCGRCMNGSEHGDLALPGAAHLS